jgi:hypothetical protein
MIKTFITILPCIYFCIFSKILLGMKIQLILSLCCLANFLSAQGVINSIEIVPSSPTVVDSVQLVGHFTFSHGGCEKELFVASVVGSSVIAEARHCLGMLTVICDESDTINLGILASGVYSVDLSLYTGFGMTPCTIDSIADATDNSTFTVSPATSALEVALDFKIVPNPAASRIIFMTKNPQEFSEEPIRLFGSNGQRLIEKKFFEHCSLDVSDLCSGLYYIQIGGKNHTVLSRKIVIER